MTYHFDFITALKEANKIDEVITEAGVKLRKAGSEMVALCPFHNETRPSFSVDVGRGVYYCHGCQASGDVITFIQEYHGYSFWEAVEHLAKRSGIEIPPNLDPNLRRGFVFADGLSYVIRECFTARDRAVGYLISRGFQNAHSLVIRYGIVDGKRLNGELTRRPELSWYLEEIGVRYKGHEPFADRVVFPVYTRSNVVVGLAGRTLKNIEPKWLYTRFEKTRFFWGWQGLRPDIKTPILVEGPLDVLALDGRALAILGSYVSGAQAKQLHNYEEVILALDGDEAGRKGTLASVKTLLRHGKFVRVISLPSGKDPADMVSGEIPEPQDWIVWLRGLYDDTLTSRVKFANVVGGVLKGLPPLLQMAYEKTAKEIL